MVVGLKYTSETVVCLSNTAAAIGSGVLDVFATPAMIALMENAAANAAAAVLPAGSTTVGTLVNVVHTRATPVGGKVAATAVLKETDGRRLVFDVSASDDDGPIGNGLHERFIVDSAKFMAKAGGKQ